MTNEVHLRVACAGEREVLMGFSPWHIVQGIAGKRGKGFGEDIRCSMIGNSFHTGEGMLVGRFLHLNQITTHMLGADLDKEIRRSQREIYVGHLTKPKGQPDGSYLDRLEHQSDALVEGVSLLDEERVTVLNLIRHSSYRGTDVHVDTLQFFRPDRLPRTSIDARKWKMEDCKRLEMVFLTRFS